MKPDLNQFHFCDKNGHPVSVFDFGIFEYLCKKEDLFILGGVPYIYRNGVYQMDQSGAQLKTMIRDLIFPEFIRSNTIERIYRLFLSAEELQISSEELNQYPPYWINFRNSMYDPVSRKLIPHDPKYRAINQIPHDYDPEADPKGEEVKSWLDFIVPDPDDREMLLQFCGLCLTRDTRQQKFMILTGSGGTGKSIVIRMIENLTGASNVSNVSLKELSQRFASYGLLGKLVNSCADLEISALEDTSVIKKILGEDSIRAEQKGRDAIFFRNYAKLIFSTNETPLVKGEKTNGFFRRLLILPMNRQPEKIKPDFFDHLEKEYFLRLSVNALERLYQTGTICESSRSKEAVRQLRMDSDNVLRWMTERTVKNTSGFVSRSGAYEDYFRFCNECGQGAERKQAFFRSLRLRGISEVKTAGIWGFKGISLCEKCPEELSTIQRT